jgi:hypothetical protein
MEGESLEDMEAKMGAMTVETAAMEEMTAAMAEMTEAMAEMTAATNFLDCLRSIDSHSYKS